MMYKQRDILLVPIPFSDLSSAKKRPVLVLSNNRYNRTTNDLIVTAITSNITKGEYNVLLSSDNMEEGELKVDSCIRPDKIYTLSQDIVIKKFGSVTDFILDRVTAVILHLTIRND